MRDGGYRRRLRADLPVWREQGWVSEEGAAAILASLPEAGPAIGLAGIVAGMGAILLGCGVLAVVAANWEEIPRLARLVGLMLLLAGAFATAWRFHAKGHPRLAEAAAIVAGLVYGGSIALVAQSYHISGHASGGVLLWTIGCLAAAGLTGSRSLLVLSLGGGAAWTYLVTDESRIVVHWAGLLPLAAGAALAAAFDSPRARRLAVLALAFWAAVALVNASMLLGWRTKGMLALGAAVALAFWSLGALAITLRDRPLVAAFGRDLRWTALVAAILCVGALQEAYGRYGLPGRQGWIGLAALALVPAIGLAVLARLRGGLDAVHAGGVAAIGTGALLAALMPPDGEMLFRIFGGVVVIVAALWAVHLGQSGRQGSARTIGLAVFGIEVFYLYVRTIGTVLDTGIAFLLGGLLFIALATALFRFERRTTRHAQGVAA